MSAPLQAARLKTPARLYRMANTPTEFGGFVPTPELMGTVWGEFAPEVPVSGLTPEGEALVRQQAVFTCRAAEGMRRGGRLVIEGSGWQILAFDVDSGQGGAGAYRTGAAMSVDPLRALQKGLLTFLKAQTSLQVWLGAAVRVYDEVPPEVVYPYVRLGRAEARSVGGLGPEVTEQVLTLTAVSRFAGTEEARAIAAELRLLLEQADLSLEGQHVVSVRVTYVDVFRSSDRYSVHGVVRLRVVSEGVG